VRQRSPRGGSLLERGRNDQAAHLADGGDGVTVQEPLLRYSFSKPEDGDPT